MISPYKAELLKYVDTVTVVTVDRDGASPVNGTVVTVDDYGVHVKQPGPDPISEQAINTFIAYGDIRGVSRVVPDYDLIQK